MIKMTTRKREKKQGSPTGIDRAEAAGVQSVDRALRILELLGSDADGFRLADLAVHSALPPSTVHRLLTTLEQRRFVQFDKENSTWHVGERLFAIGASFLRRRHFVASAMPILRGLRDTTRENVNLGIADAGEILLLAQVESREVIRVISPVGGRVPMTSDAIGKAILSTYSDEEVAQIIALHGMRRMTDTTITRASELHEALKVVRKVGYAVDLGEYIAELRCIASPIIGTDGSALAAISISGLASRLPDARIPDLGRLVADAARQLTSALVD